jgi:hypothetical protein
MFKAEREYNLKDNEGLWIFDDREYNSDLKICFVDRKYNSGRGNIGKKHVLY